MDWRQAEARWSSKVEEKSKTCYLVWGTCLHISPWVNI